MIVDATQLKPARLEAPPSKSDAHRAFVLAWMLKLPQPQLTAWPTDVRRIAEGLRKLGSGELIDCGDGAAPFRILLALAATTPGRSAFTGTARLAERPHAPLFRALGLQQAGWPLVVEGRPPPDHLEVDCTTSSQYASALLLAACRAHLEHGRPVHLALTGTVASRGYLDLTTRWARDAGFHLDETVTRISVVGHVRPAALPPVPPDWSSLGYLLLISLASSSEVDARGAGEHPDRTLLQFLDVEDRGGLLRVRAAKRDLDADVALAPDLAPTLAALALGTGATAVLRNVSILRHKESDRLAAILDLARGHGELDGETLRLRPARPEPFSLDCRNDHRLTLAAVSLACLWSCRAELHRTDGVDKSFPGFFEQAARAGARCNSPSHLRSP